ARDVGLRSTRGKRKRGIARIQVSEMTDLVGHHGAANAAMLRPAMHARLKKGAVDNELTAAFEQVEQTHLALESVEFVLFLHSQPRHPPALRRQRVTGAGEGLLLGEHLQACSIPLLRRYDRRRLHQDSSFPTFRLLVMG